MDRALSWFVRGWVAIAIAVNVVAIVGLMIGAHGFWHGWHRVAEIYSPFNPKNYLLELVLVSPAIGAYTWLERRRKREAGPPQSMSAQEVQQIVNAYGAAMAEPGGMVVDTLTYQKEPIKQALLKVTAPGPARDQEMQQIDEAMGGMVRDVGTLPYPKERIKQALLTAIMLTPPGPAREQLRCGFVMLADWQDSRASDPTAAMLAEGKAFLAELRSLGL